MQKKGVLIKNKQCNSSTIQLYQNVVFLHTTNAVIAKRSVVSAANYVVRSSFAKDQRLFFFLYRSESACKRGSHTTYFFVSSWSAYCCEVAMMNVVLIHGFDTVYLHQGVSYIASSGLLTFNLKLITSGTSFIFAKDVPEVISLKLKG